jgi:DNA-binding GntR family transcriptional regulator
MTGIGRLDRTRPLPLYHQAAETLERAVRDGRYATGSLLEGEHELARLLGVSRPTLRRAVDDLVRRGLLAREHGVGTRVLAQRVTRTLVSELTGLHDDLVDDGIEPTTSVLGWGTGPCPRDAAEHLGVPPGDEVALLRRVRAVRGVPIAFMRNVLAPGVLTVEAEELERASLYGLLRVHGHAPRVADQTIGAERADDEVAELLDIPTGSPVLVLGRRTFDASGVALEFARTVYAADRYTFAMRLVAT